MALLDSGIGMRTVLFVILAVFLFPAITFADDAPKLPSRKASVVLPLLEHFAPKDNSSQAILDGVTKILGNYDLGDGGGPEDNHWNYFQFVLNDKTQVIVEGRRDVYSVDIIVPGQPQKILYPRPAH